MDVFATVCLGITAVAGIAIHYWIAHIASDMRKARLALEDLAHRSRRGDSGFGEATVWPPADEAA